MIQFPKKTAAILQGREEPHIFKDPPRSLHTHKKEFVEIGDVLYNIQNDDSRINEGVNYVQRGVNPMVKVSYSNHGNGATPTSIVQPQASNPYKVAKDGAFRPPQYRLEDLEPLSRARREWVSVTTNPGKDNLTSSYSEITDKNIDRRQIVSSIHPTASYKRQIALEDKPISLKEVSIIPITSLPSDINSINNSFPSNRNNNIIVKPLISSTSPLNYPFELYDTKKNVKFSAITDRPLTTSIVPISFPISNSRNFNDKKDIKGNTIISTSSSRKINNSEASREINISSNLSNKKISFSSNPNDIRAANVYNSNYILNERDLPLKDRDIIPVTSQPYASISSLERQDISGNATRDISYYTATTPLSNLMVLESRNEVIPLENKMPLMSIGPTVNALKYDYKDLYDQDHNIKTKERNIGEFESRGYIPTSLRENNFRGKEREIEVERKIKQEMSGRWLK